MLRDTCRTKSAVAASFPTMSSFTYSPLGDGSIRLLHLDPVVTGPRDQLHCTLVEARLDPAPEYDTISYAWNDEKPAIPIVCNGQILLITVSLHTALCTMRDAVIQVTKARLVNTLTSTLLTLRSRVISALGRYNQKCSVVENECV